MGLFTPPFIAIGEKVTGATLNSRFDSFASSTSGIVPATQADPEARFPSSLFAEDAAPAYWSVHGVLGSGAAAGASREWTLTARASGRYLGVSAADNLTILAGPITVAKNGTALVANDTIAEGDVITATVPRGYCGTVRFRWRHVRRPS